MATNKDILERLNCIEQNVSSGQLDEISQTVKEIKEILLDPEDGLIVRVNKNTYWRRQIDTRDIQELKTLKLLKLLKLVLLEYRKNLFFCLLLHFLHDGGKIYQQKIFDCSIE